MDRKEMLEKFGNVEMVFSSYYKYTFYFKNNGICGNYRFESSYGGISEDIYRCEINNNPIMLKGYEEEFMTLKIYDGNEVIFEWDDGSY